MDKISRPKSLTDNVADSLRNAILNGEMRLGQSLSENRLSEMFSVSKTPVREALFILKQEGLVEILPQKGSYVFYPNSEEVADLCQYRSFIEPIAIEQSMIHNAEGFLKDLEQCIEEMESYYVANDIRQFINQDSRFHHLFFSYCGNQNLKRNYRRIRYHIDALRCYLSNDEVIMERILEDHKAIFQYLSVKEIDQAKSILTSHVLKISPAFEDVIS